MVRIERSLMSLIEFITSVYTIVRIKCHRFINKMGLACLSWLLWMSYKKMRRMPLIEWPGWLKYIICYAIFQKFFFFFYVTVPLDLYSFLFFSPRRRFVLQTEISGKYISTVSSLLLYFCLDLFSLP